MSNPREQIDRDRRFVNLDGRYMKRRYSKWRRRQEKRDAENAPVRRSVYRGWHA